MITSRFADPLSWDDESDTTTKYSMIENSFDASMPNESELCLKENQEVGERFILEKPLGFGGFGQVWKVKDRWLDQHVALKLSRDEMLSEVILLRQLPKERYISIFDYVRDEATGSYGYTMEILDAPWMTLDKYYNEKLLPKFEKNEYLVAIKKVITISVDLLTSLSLLHGKKHSSKDRWYHADIKPNNLFVHSKLVRKVIKNRWGDLCPPMTKIGDLGLARRSGTPMSSGTHGFRAPEQNGHGKFSTAGDIYAFAQTLIYLISGDYIEDLSHIKQIEKRFIKLIPSNYLVSKLTIITREMTYKTASRRPSALELIKQFKKIVISDIDWLILEIFSNKEVGLTKSQAARKLFEQLACSRGWINYTEYRTEEMSTLIKNAYKSGILTLNGKRYSLQ
jgi:serine/threonine protein kinase